MEEDWRDPRTRDMGIARHEAAVPSALVRAVEFAVDVARVHDIGVPWIDQADSAIAPGCQRHFAIE